MTIPKVDKKELQQAWDIICDYLDTKFAEGKHGTMFVDRGAWSEDKFGHINIHTHNNKTEPILFSTKNYSYPEKTIIADLPQDESKLAYCTAENCANDPAPESEDDLCQEHHDNQTEEWEAENKHQAKEYRDSVL